MRDWLLNSPHSHCNGDAVIADKSDTIATTENYFSQKKSMSYALVDSVEGSVAPLYLYPDTVSLFLDPDSFPVSHLMVLRSTPCCICFFICSWSIYSSLCYTVRYKRMLSSHPAPSYLSAPIKAIILIFAYQPCLPSPFRSFSRKIIRRQFEESPISRIQRHRGVYGLVRRPANARQSIAEISQLRKVRIGILVIRRESITLHY